MHRNPREINSSSFTAYKWHSVDGVLMLYTDRGQIAYLVITCPVRTVTSKHWGKKYYILYLKYISMDVKQCRHFCKFLTSAAIKATVCMPWWWPTRPQSTARPPQHNSMDTSRASTRTWLLMGVVGENDSWKKKDTDMGMFSNLLFIHGTRTWQRPFCIYTLKQAKDVSQNGLKVLTYSKRSLQSWTMRWRKIRTANHKHHSTTSSTVCTFSTPNMKMNL